MEKELEKQITDEKTGISYTLFGDYYLPNFELPKMKKINLNKYSRTRLDFLKEHKKSLYEEMILNGTLNKHLDEIQKTAQRRINKIIDELKAKSDLTENMKSSNMLYWVGEMNAIKNQAEEIVLSDLIII